MTTTTRPDLVKPTPTERTAVRTGAVDARRTPGPKPQKPKRSLGAKLKLLVAVILRRPFVAHLMLAAKRFGERLGSQFAGAITYFSFLALMPILLVSFSVAGFVLASHPDLVADLRDAIQKQIPGGSGNGGLGTLIGQVLDSAIASRGGLLSVGIISALYSAVGWMGNVRAAVQAQWRPDFDDDQEIQQDSFLKNLWKNLYMFVGLGLAIVLSFVFSGVGVQLSKTIVNWLGLGNVGLFATLLSVLAFVLAIAADLLIFMWVFTVLPPANQKATRKALIRGSLIAAVGFEVMKFLLTFFLPKVTSNASGAVFGPIIGLLFFFNLVATLILFVAAWIATSPGGQGDPNRPQKVKENEEVVEPAVIVPESLSRKRAVGYVGVGAILGLGAASRAGLLRRRRP